VTQEYLDFDPCQFPESAQHKDQASIANRVTGQFEKDILKVGENRAEIGEPYPILRQTMNHRGGDGTPVEGGDPARERVDEAVQFGVWKCPVDVSVSFRGVAVEIVRAENDFERPTATDQMWKTFRTAAAGMHSHPDFGLAESRV